jgi:hypothetical protein
MAEGNKPTPKKKPTSKKSTTKGSAMDSKKLGKYLFWAGVILAVVLALWPEPEDWAYWLLVIFGLVGGYTRVSKDSETHFIVLALGLSVFGSIIGEIPTLGEFLVDIYEGISIFMGAAVIAVVTRNIIGWFRS